MSVAYRSTCRPTVGQTIAADMSTDISTDISTDLSIDISTDISRSICRSSVGRYIDRYSADVSVDMSADTRPMYRSICRPIHRSRGAQNTHDPKVTIPSQRQFVVAVVWKKFTGKKQIFTFFIKFMPLFPCCTHDLDNKEWNEDITMWNFLQHETEIFWIFRKQIVLSTSGNFTDKLTQLWSIYSCRTHQDKGWQ